MDFSPKGVNTNPCLGFLIQCTLAGSYSEGATLSQFIILAHKGETLVETVGRKDFNFIYLFHVIIY